MDEAKVMLLFASAGMVELPPHLEKLADDEEWWEALEATPEDKLTDEQREMIAELGVDLPPRG